MVRLIVTGDDFGDSPVVNAAIARAHDEGILTSASLLVAADGAEDALRVARARPALSVGLHLALAGGRAVLPRAEVPGLVDAAGRFPRSAVVAGWRLAADRALRIQARREVQAQVERYLATGLRLDHLTGHLNIHMHPCVVPIVAEVAALFGVRAVRIPRDNLRLALAGLRHGHLSVLAHAAIFAPLGTRARRAIAPRGMAFPRRVYGFLRTGRMTEQYLLRVIEHLPPGDHEVYLHPGAASRGEDDTAILVSPRVRAALSARGVALISYADL